MTVGAAIAPVAGYDRRQRASRMIVVGVAYVAVVAAGVIYPFVSPLRDFWNALPPLRSQPTGSAASCGYRSCWSRSLVSRMVDSGN
jgi:hypothetical protein